MGWFCCKPKIRPGTYFRSSNSLARVNSIGDKRVFLTILHADYFWEDQREIDDFKSIYSPITREVFDARLNEIKLNALTEQVKALTEEVQSLRSYRDSLESRLQTSSIPKAKKGKK